MRYWPFVRLALNFLIFFWSVEFRKCQSLLKHKSTHLSTFESFVEAVLTVVKSFKAAGTVLMALLYFLYSQRPAAATYLFLDWQQLNLRNDLRPLIIY